MKIYYEESDKLKPCPFCGNKARFARYHYSIKVWNAECTVCKCQTHVQFTKEDALNIWNMRAET